MKIKFNLIIAIIYLSLLNVGCTVVSANRVFPKLTWYWSEDAKEQRRENENEKKYHIASPENKNK